MEREEEREKGGRSVRERGERKEERVTGKGRMEREEGQIGTGREAGRQRQV